MEDKRDSGDRRRGKHNLNFEDHFLNTFICIIKIYIEKYYYPLNFFTFCHGTTTNREHNCEEELKRFFSPQINV